MKRTATPQEIMAAAAVSDGNPEEYAIVLLAISQDDEPALAFIGGEVVELSSGMDTSNNDDIPF